jgi:5-formyltetrahydrofolate cyclo-ligase
MSEQLLLDKKKTRQRVLQQRRAFSATEKTPAEQRMLKFLQSWEIFRQAKTIHIFISKTDEPDTSPIIESAWESGKTVAVPCVVPESFELFHSQLKSFEDLSSGALGVLEPSPEGRIAMNPESFDLVIIPGVAFDRQGGRLGYGKGYYDRFLEQTAAFRLALAFNFQVLEKVPTEKHDVPMNGILTESGIIEVNN